MIMFWRIKRLSETGQKIVIMNFSGIYEQESFYKDYIKKEIDLSWIDLRHLLGCNCYCDDNAKDEIKEKIKRFSGKEIHFIDSGNYHYMSKIWLEKIDRSFRLLVFDNHTDMQPPAFGGILSCGGWIADSVEDLPNLKEIYLVGPDEESFEQVDESIKVKTKFLSREKLLYKRDYFDNISTDLPLYISIDKDVLCEEDASTTWSQGEMKIDELCFFIKKILNRFKEANQSILGIDICGECDLDQMLYNDKNDKANHNILTLVLEGNIWT